MMRSLRDDGLLIVGFLTAYVLMDWASLAPPTGPLNTPPWSPSAGLAVVLAARRGWRWGGLILAAELLTDLLLSARGVGQYTPLSSFASALSAAVAYGCFGWWGRRRNIFTFAQTGDVVAFAVLVALAAGVAALGAMVGAFQDGVHDPGGLFEIYLKIWLSDAAGAAIAAPFFDALLRRRRGVVLLREMLAVILVMGAVSLGALYTERPIFYPMFLPVVWGALRRGVAGAVSVTALTQTGLILAAHLRIHGQGAFLSYQLVMMVLSLTGLLLGVASDARRRAESALNASREQLDLVIRAAPNAIVTLGDDGRVCEANPAALRLFGLASLTGAPFDDLAPGWREAKRGAPLEVEVRRANGALAPVELAAQRLPDDAGAVVTLVDLSARKEAESIRRDRQAAHGAVESEGRVGEVVSAIVHEVSQPLAAITAYGRAARTLLAQAHPNEGEDRLAQTLERIVSQSERAGRILRRLRDYFQRPEARREPARLGDLIHEAIELCETSLQSAQVRLTVAAAARTADVSVDRTQIVQVFANLIRNAAEAMAEAESPHRRIIIDAAPAEDEPDRLLQVTISDTGPGAPPHLTPRLFEPFETSRRDGMGLGLSLSRSFVEAHGCTMGYTPLQGGGASFYFTIPLQTPNADTHDEEAAA